MSVQSFDSSIPTDLAQSGEPIDIKPEDVKSYILGWKNSLKRNRVHKLAVWDECWQLYRGLEDWTDKEDWQSKLTIPKSWNSVKQATNVIKRLLSTSQNPWNFEPVNPDDLVTAVRSQQSTDLVKVFMDNANYREHFAEGLECGFIMGLGLWKMWWALTPRLRTAIQQGQDPQTGMPVRQLVQQEILEGNLNIRAVDPYNFYWLPGSRLNKWVGTLEEIEIPKWELMELASQGVFDPEEIKKLSPGRIDPVQDRRRLRHDEPSSPSSQQQDTEIVKLLEYYGPLVKENVVIERNAHVVLANDDKVILIDKNPFLHRKPPYIGFSPLSLPFRTEGIGLVEMVRQVDKAINRLANMSMDTLLFRLLPIFEVPIDLYENPEDFQTGLQPGKIFRRNQAGAGMQGLNPIEFQDISSGTIQVAGQLDRAHQEGALVSEIQQALPRFRGAQTATETEIKNENIQSFFGNMAVDIEEQALKPMLEMAWELVFQFIDTANDPRVAAILGQGADVLRGMSREEIQETIQGDYTIKVGGISDQLEKAEMLQNLMQFLNIMGQNPENWLPYLNQSALLRRVLEAFRPTIRDLDQIVADPATVEAVKQSLQQDRLAPDIMAQQVAMIDQSIRMQQEQAKQQAEMQNQQFQMKMAELDLRLKQADLDLKYAQIDATEAKAGHDIEAHRKDLENKPS